MSLLVIFYTNIVVRRAFDVTTSNISIVIISIPIKLKFFSLIIIKMKNWLNLKLKILYCYPNRLLGLLSLAFTRMFVLLTNIKTLIIHRVQECLYSLFKIYFRIIIYPFGFKSNIFIVKILFILIFFGSLLYLTGIINYLIIKNLLPLFFNNLFKYFTLLHCLILILNIIIKSYHFLIVLCFNKNNYAKLHLKKYLENYFNSYLKKCFFMISHLFLLVLSMYFIFKCYHLFVKIDPYLSQMMLIVPFFTSFPIAFLYIKYISKQKDYFSKYNLSIPNSTFVRLFYLFCLGIALNLSYNFILDAHSTFLLSSKEGRGWSTIHPVGSAAALKENLNNLILEFTSCLVKKIDILKNLNLNDIVLFESSYLLYELQEGVQYCDKDLIQNDNNLINLMEENNKDSIDNDIKDNDDKNNLDENNTNQDVLTNEENNDKLINNSQDSENIPTQDKGKGKEDAIEDEDNDRKSTQDKGKGKADTIEYEEEDGKTISQDKGKGKADVEQFKESNDEKTNNAIRAPYNNLTQSQYSYSSAASSSHSSTHFGVEGNASTSNQSPYSTTPNLDSSSTDQEQEPYSMIERFPNLWKTIALEEAPINNSSNSSQEIQKSTSEEFKTQEDKPVPGNDNAAADSAFQEDKPVPDSDTADMSHVRGFSMKNSEGDTKSDDSTISDSKTIKPKNSDDPKNSSGSQSSFLMFFKNLFKRKEKTELEKDMAIPRWFYWFFFIVFLIFNVTPYLNSLNISHPILDMLNYIINIDIKWVALFVLVWSASFTLYKLIHLLLFTLMYYNIISMSTPNSKFPFSKILLELQEKSSGEEKDFYLHHHKTVTSIYVFIFILTLIGFLFTIL